MPLLVVIVGNTTSHKTDRLEIEFGREVRCFENPPSSSFYRFSTVSKLTIFQLVDFDIHVYHWSLGVKLDRDPIIQ